EQHAAVTEDSQAFADEFLSRTDVFNELKRRYHVERIAFKWKRRNHCAAELQVWNAFVTLPVFFDRLLIIIDRHDAGCRRRHQRSSVSQSTADVENRFPGNQRFRKLIRK